MDRPAANFSPGAYGKPVSVERYRRNTPKSREVTTKNPSADGEGAGANSAHATTMIPKGMEIACFILGVNYYYNNGM
jgi:hypothetical protein